MTAIRDVEKRSHVVGLPRFVFRQLPTHVFVFVQGLSAVLLYATRTSAQQAPSGAATSCLGFLCGVRAALLADPAFSGTAAVVTLIFVALNTVIVLAIGWRAYQIWTARSNDEEYKGLATSLVIGVFALVIFNYVAAFVYGV